MEKKYRAIIYTVACLSGLTMGAALASSGYIGLLFNWFLPPIGGFGGQREQLTYTSYTWGTDNAYLNITVKNTSPMNLSIVQVQVNDKSVTPNTPALPYTPSKDTSVTIQVTSTFNSRTQYTFKVMTAKGNQFGPYTLTAP